MPVIEHRLAAGKASFLFIYSLSLHALNSKFLNVNEAEKDDNFDFV